MIFRETVCSMHDKWDFIIQLPVTPEILFDLKDIAGVKDAYGEGALLTIVPDNSVTFESVHKWLSGYLRQKHKKQNV